MDVLETENMIEDNKEIYDFFKQLNIKDVQKLVVKPDHDDLHHYTDFYFTTENGTKLIFYYEKNRKVLGLYIMKENDTLFIYIEDIYREWLNHIWEQFVDHFNLRVCLMFINKNMPWRWELEYKK